MCRAHVNILTQILSLVHRFEVKQISTWLNLTIVRNHCKIIYSQNLRLALESVKKSHHGRQTGIRCLPRWKAWKEKKQGSQKEEGKTDRERAGWGSLTAFHNPCRYDFFLGINFLGIKFTKRLLSTTARTFSC